MTDCIVTDRIAGPCVRCGEFQAKQVHLVDEHAILCADCCLVHRQASLEWGTEKPVTTEGTQEGLFG